MGRKSDIKELEENIDSLEHFIEQYTKLEKKTERPHPSLHNTTQFRKGQQTDAILRTQKIAVHPGSSKLKP